MPLSLLLSVEEKNVNQDEKCHVLFANFICINHKYPCKNSFIFSAAPLRLLFPPPDQFCCCVK